LVFVASYTLFTIVGGIASLLTGILPFAWLLVPTILGLAFFALPWLGTVLTSFGAIGLSAIPKIPLGHHAATEHCADFFGDCGHDLCRYHHRLPHGVADLGLYHDGAILDDPCGNHRGGCGDARDHRLGHRAHCDLYDPWACDLHHRHRHWPWRGGAVHGDGRACVPFGDHWLATDGNHCHCLGIPGDIAAAIDPIGSWNFALIITLVLWAMAMLLQTLIDVASTIVTG